MRLQRGPPLGEATTLGERLPPPGLPPTHWCLPVWGGGTKTCGFGASARPQSFAPPLAFVCGGWAPRGWPLVGAREVLPPLPCPTNPTSKQQVNRSPLCAPICAIAPTACQEQLHSWPGWCYGDGNVDKAKEKKANGDTLLIAEVIGIADYNREK